jgi:hypothetical protein
MREPRIRRKRRQPSRLEWVLGAIIVAPYLLLRWVVHYLSMVVFVLLAGAVAYEQAPWWTLLLAILVIAEARRIKP